MALRLAYVVPVAAAVALVAYVVALAFAGGGGPSTQLLRPPPPTASCSSSGTAEFNGTTYWSCTVALNWSNASSFASTELASVTFQGVQFVVYGYFTIECPVVNVTGYEATGAISSFLIYATPSNCSEFMEPTVFSPDFSFGATWTGGESFQLLVRVG